MSRARRPHPLAENAVYGMAAFLALTLAWQGLLRLMQRWAAQPAPAVRAAPPAELPAAAYPLPVPVNPHRPPPPPLEPSGRTRRAATLDVKIGPSSR